MRIQSLLLASLLAGLYGCQPEAPVQEVVPVAVPASAVSAVETAASGVAAPAEKAVQAVDTAQAKAVVAEAAPVVVKAAPMVEKARQVVAKTAVPDKAEPVAVKAAAVVPPKVAAVVAASPAPAEVVKPEVVVSSAVSEADALALAKKNNCLTCHAVDHKVVGPAWKDVAVKYRGDATAEAYLVSKIATGGSGVWGNMKMPAHPKISEADRTTLARFVLNLK